MNAIKRWIVRKEVEGFVDNAIKESQMSPTAKSYLIGLANALISGVVSGGTSLSLGVGWKHSAMILGASAFMSLAKWVVQHPLPGGVQ